MPGKPIIVGVSAPGFAAMRSLARQSMDLGAAGVMIAPPPSAAHRRPDHRLLRPGRRSDRRDIPFVIQDYPLTLSVVMTPAVIRKIVMDNPSCVMLKHEDWPGLEKISTLRKFQADGSLAADLDPDRQWRHVPRFRDGARRRRRDDRLRLPRTADRRGQAAEGRQRDEAHDIFDAHLPLMRYEQQQGVGLAVRKYTLMKRGILASSDAQRKPGVGDHAKAKAEVDYLLARVAKHDPRAKV
jgi:4-hydroxy-tetrahydrodipicolinate synthase